MEKRALQAKLHESALKWDPLRSQYQGRSVAKKSSDTVNFSSTESRRALMGRAALRMGGDTKLGSLVSQKPFGEQSSLDGWRQTGSRVTRDVRARASMGDTGESVPQEQLFREKFIEILEDRGFIERDREQDLIHIYGGEEEQFSSINSDSHPYDVPAEWRVPFFIARGQLFEEKRMSGAKIEQNPVDNVFPGVILFQESSGEACISKERCPSAVADRLRKYPDQEVKVSTTICDQDIDSLSTCMKVYEELKRSGSEMILYELQRDKFEKDTLEWKKLRKSQIDIELKYALFIHKLQKNINEFQKDISKIDDYKLIQRFNKTIREIKGISLKYERIMIEGHKEIFKRKNKELEQSKNVKDAYDMMMGTPEVRSIVGKIPKDYIVDSITIERQPAIKQGVVYMKNEKLHLIFHLDRTAL